MEAFAIPFLLVIGALLAVQAGANVQLAGAMASPFGGSTLQLSLAAGVLALAAGIGGSLGALDGLGDVRGWTLLGGLGSAIYITSGIVLFPRLGAVVTVALWIAGQMLGSLVLDWTGWLGIAAEGVSASELAGAALVVGGAALVARAQGGATGLAPGRAGWVALALAAGAALPVQGAVNAELRAELDAVLAAATVSFAVAAAAMGALLAFALATGSARLRPAGLRCLPWWGWLGGLIGAAYVTAVFSLIPEIGTAPTIALTVGGQQLASIAVDRFGLLRLPRRPVSATRLAAVAALLLGVALILLA